MRVSFKLLADQEVQVSNGPDSTGVNVEFIEGAWFDGMDNRTRKTYWLSKSAARAVASAIMGCAAEA